MAFPYDDQPPVRDPALPPLTAPKMTDAQAAAVSAQLSQIPGGQAAPPAQAQSLGSSASPLNPAQFTQGAVNLNDQRIANVRDTAASLTDLNNQTGDVYKQDIERRQKEIADEATIKAQADRLAEQRDLDSRRMAQQLLAKNIDPEHYWNSKSTGGKVLASIGLALGSAGASLSKGQNIPLQMMNQAIANDIDSQKENMNNGWKAYDKLHDLNNDETARTRYNDAWRAQHYIMGSELIKSQLGQIAAKTSNVDVKEKANTAISALEGAQLDVRKSLGDQIAAAAKARAAGQASLALAQKNKIDKLSEQAGKDVQALVEKGVSEADAQKTVYSRPQNAILADAGLAPQEFRDVAAAKTKLVTDAQTDLAAKRGVLSKEAYDKYEKEVIKSFNTQVKDLNESIKPTAGGLDVGGKKAEKTVIYNGKSYVAPTDEDARKFREIADAGAEFKSLVQAEIASRQARGGGTLSPQATAESEQRRALIIGALGKMGGTGTALTDKERENFEKLVPNSNDWTYPFGSDNIMSKLQNLLTIPDAKVGAAFKIHVGNETSGGTSTPSAPANAPKIDFTPHK